MVFYNKTIPYASPKSKKSEFFRDDKNFHSLQDCMFFVLHFRKVRLYYHYIFHISGYSAVWSSAFDWGSKGREFKSLYPDHFKLFSTNGLRWCFFIAPSKRPVVKAFAKTKALSFSERRIRGNASAGGQLTFPAANSPFGKTADLSVMIFSSYCYAIYSNRNTPIRAFS